MDPTLAEYAQVFNETGHSAFVCDARNQLVFITDEARIQLRAITPDVDRLIGQHLFGPASKSDGNWVDEKSFRQSGPWLLFNTPGGRDELRRQIDPSLRDLVDQIDPAEPPSIWRAPPENRQQLAGVTTGFEHIFMRVRDRTGTFVGTVWLWKPQAGMSQLTSMAAVADLEHLDRMDLVDRPDRRPAAVLMADLEASSPLAKRLSTAQFFAFGRRLVRAADKIVIDHGGIVGRHAGDGIVAFFLAETAGSESSAARACIATARALRNALIEIAGRTGIDDPNVALRFGLHWGATLYVGRITTPGRTEVTALGDEVNETARIEACATGGRTIASKPLLERLTASDAHTLGIDPGTTTYTPLGELPTATEKARRDAPAIAVTDLTD